MIASATWWRRVRRAAATGSSGIAVGGALLLIQSCQGQPPAEGTAPPPPLPPRTNTGGEAPAAPADGLVPLPSRSQVVAAVALGRTDPFAPLVRPLPPNAAAGGSTPAGAAGRGAAGQARRPVLRPRPTLPPDFRFTGVIAGGGRSEAVVQFGALSGSLRPGDRGGRTTDLLPRGWSVASIDVERGHLTLLHGDQRIRADLGGL